MRARRGHRTDPAHGDIGRARRVAVPGHRAVADRACDAAPHRGPRGHACGDRNPDAGTDRIARAEAVRDQPRESADFVPQYTFEWCVGASIMMARSILTDSRNESRASQRRLWELARDLTVGSPYGGANPAGWAAALNELDLGQYRLVSLPTFDAAVDRAALALAETRRPVGLVMWAGRHAWVMTGFKATADPRKHDGARVTRVRVMDPLYPHGSRWGASPAPNRLITLKTLAKQFVMRNRPEYDFGVDPGWLLVLPVD